MIYTLVFGFIAFWMIISIFREFYLWHLTKKLTDANKTLKKVKDIPMYEINKRCYYGRYHIDITSYNSKIDMIRKCSMNTLVAYILVPLCEFILPIAKTMIE